MTSPITPHIPTLQGEGSAARSCPHQTARFRSRLPAESLA
jgi:hypothetical protein